MNFSTVFECFSQLFVIPAMPKYILSDQNSLFVSHELQSYLQSWCNSQQLDHLPSYKKCTSQTLQWYCLENSVTGFALCSLISWQFHIESWFHLMLILYMFIVVHFN